MSHLKKSILFFNKKLRKRTKVENPSYNTLFFYKKCKDPKNLFSSKKVYFRQRKYICKNNKIRHAIISTLSKNNMATSCELVSTPNPSLLENIDASHITVSQMDPHENKINNRESENLKLMPQKLQLNPVFNSISNEIEEFCRSNDVEQCELQNKSKITITISKGNQDQGCMWAKEYCIGFDVAQRIIERIFGLICENSATTTKTTTSLEAFQPDIHEKIQKQETSEKLPEDDEKSVHESVFITENDSNLDEEECEERRYSAFPF